jgi:hypothetical protein
VPDAIGVVKAEVDILDDVPAAYAQAAMALAISWMTR